MTYIKTEYKILCKQNQEKHHSGSLIQDIFLTPINKRPEKNSIDLYRTVEQIIKFKRSRRDMKRPVGTCHDLLGTGLKIIRFKRLKRELLGTVGRCRELYGIIGVYIIKGLKPFLLSRDLSCKAITYGVKGVNTYLNSKALESKSLIRLIINTIAYTYGAMIYPLFKAVNINHNNNPYGAMKNSKSLITKLSALSYCYQRFITQKNSKCLGLN